MLRGFEFKGCWLSSPDSVGKMSKGCQQIAFFNAKNFMFLVLCSQSWRSLFVLPSPLYTSHTANHSRGILLFFLLFIPCRSHEETNHPFIPMKDSLARITAEGPNSFSDISVQHHQYRPTVSTQRAGSTVLTLKVSHCGEMRHNKPFRRILIPDRIAFYPPRSLQNCLSCRTKRQQPATFVSLWPFTFFIL